MVGPHGHAGLAMKADLIAEVDRDRFYARVDQRGPDECWPWTGSATKKDGRGRFSVRGRNVVAPRLAWGIANGRMPPSDMFVCHSCDNPNCVNPAHLWLGTNSDNLRDASTKGRRFLQKHPEMGFFAQPGNSRFRAKGERHGSAKLTESEAAIIKRELAAGVTMAHLGRQFGVSSACILTIQRGRNWKHVQPAS